MKLSRNVTGFLVTFIVTVFLLQWWPHPAVTTEIWLSFLSTVLYGVLLIYRGQKDNGYLTLVITAGSVIALLAVIHAVHVTTAQDIESFVGKTSQTITGWIADIPDRRPEVTKYKIAVTSIEQNGVSKATRGFILVNDRGGWPRYRFGDPVTVRGKLELPEVIDNFDYPAYLHLSDIYAIVQSGKISPGPGNRQAGIYNQILGFLFDLREKTEAQINRVLPEPHASLLAGLLTGSKRGIPDELMNAFRSAGIAHIVAISGYNVTIILSVLAGLLFWLPLRWRFPLLVTGVIAFTLFVGAGSTVVRAAIMGILGLIALQTNRLQVIRLSILWTAFFMLLYRPAFIWDDASFQLSFLAVVGITELSPLLKRLLSFVPETLGLKETLVATLAAQIATIPLTVFIFRQLSLVAPFSNILVAPLVPAAMLIGFIGMVLGAIYWPLGLAVSYPAWAFLEAIIKIATWSAAIPFAAIKF